MRPMGIQSLSVKSDLTHAAKSVHNCFGAWINSQKIIYVEPREKLKSETLKFLRQCHELIAVDWAMNSKKKYSKSDFIGQLSN